MSDDEPVCEVTGPTGDGPGGTDPRGAAAARAVAELDEET
jgi:hypothetical protein